jgi:sigma-B regulation protein RsbU (phosphoserine phosphatase)
MPGTKILVIEGDDTFRVTLTLTLEGLGFRVLEAATAIEGVTTARLELPSLILCDSELGGLGGNLVLFAVRRDPKISTTPFILMSRFGVREDRLSAVQMGADGFLGMPFTPATLAAVIAGCITKPQGAGVPDQTTVREESSGANTALLKGLLLHVTTVIDKTCLITTAYKGMELQEIIRAAADAHDSASRLREQIEDGLQGAGIRDLADCH